MEALRSADIWVECRVHHRSGDLPDTRLLALRAGESGFLASQRTGQDVVDIYSLSAHDLGPAIARSVGLTGPGRR
ncbi:ESX secretion-associated protein EspG [Mycobacterium camsae]|uniref:ESX secretion-associated protein EspG n=1 Tax=Mycobacterium gordonae TaxID=1778 RepID=UPI003D662F66